MKVSERAIECFLHTGWRVQSLDAPRKDERLPTATVQAAPISTTDVSFIQNTARHLWWELSTAMVSLLSRSSGRTSFSSILHFAQNIPVLLYLPIMKPFQTWHKYSLRKQGYDTHRLILHYTNSIYV